MRRPWLIWVLVLGLLAALASIALVPGRSVDPDATVRQPRAITAPQHAPLAHDARVPAAPRESVPDAAVREPHAAGDNAVITGRCVAAENGEPLPGCEVFLSGMSINAQFSMDWAFHSASEVAYRFEVETQANRRSYLGLDDPSWMRPIELDRHFLTRADLARLRRERGLYTRAPNAVTDEDGRFRIEFAPDVASMPLSWSLFTWSPQRLAWRFESRTFEPGGEDLGQLQLHLGHRVRGSITRENGDGIVGARLRIEGLPAGHTAFVREPFAFGLSCGGGQFAFSDPIPSGTWRLVVSGAGLAKQTLRLTVGDRDVEQRIVVRDRPSITGIAQVEDNVRGATIDLLAVAEDGTVQGRGAIEADGRFAVHPERSGLPDVRLVTASLGWDTIDAPVPVAWGTERVAMRLRATRSFGLRLLDATTGSPVTGPINIVDRSAVARENQLLLLLGDRQDGWLVIPRMHSGRHRLSFSRNGLNTWVRTVVEVDVPVDGPRELTVRLQRATPFVVVVSDPHGEPVAEANIGVALATPIGTPMPGWYNDDGFLTDARTGADGTATLVGAPADTPIDVLAYVPGFGQAVRRGIRIAAVDQPVALTLARGGSVHGKVTPAGDQDSRWTLRFTLPDGEFFETVVGSDGAFSREALPPGTYDVQLAAGRIRGESVARLTVEAGATHELPIDAGRFALATVHVTFHGLAAANAYDAVFVADNLADRHAEPQTLAADHSLTTDLPPGSYRVFVRGSTALGASNQHYHADTRLDVAAGERSRRTIELRARDVTLAVVTESGQPAGSRQFELQYRPATRWESLRTVHTDGRGEVTINDIAPWPMRLLATAAMSVPVIWDGGPRIQIELRARAP